MQFKHLSDRGKAHEKTTIQFSSSPYSFFEECMRLRNQSVSLNIVYEAAFVFVWFSVWNRNRNVNFFPWVQDVPSFTCPVEQKAVKKLALAKGWHCKEARLGVWTGGLNGGVWDKERHRGHH